MEMEIQLDNCNNEGILNFAAVMEEMFPKYWIIRLGDG